MFKRGGVISRSLHAPHGVNINGEVKNSAGSKLKRKFSWSSPKVRGAISVGVLTHKPVILKEGYLCKPGIFRIGAKRRRWCVLRTYTQTEASIDIYADETKNKYKGSIALDKASSPILIVKNYDPKKKKAPKNCYFVIKTDGKRTFQFTADSFRELKEWTALTRQAIDNGHLFSGKVIEPSTIAEGMVNVKFNAKCISILCPINEIPIKTWRLDQITSFGQSGGMLMFESCSTCSDPGSARCSMNIIQEKPSTILNLMEKSIRTNCNTGEIHYERSILGDIYHCDHDCSARGMLPAFSEPNIFRSASSSPVKGLRHHNIPVDLHEFEQLPGDEQSDSGYPGTPRQHDDLSLASSIPSPVGSNRSNPSAVCKLVVDECLSPTHPPVRENRSMSESTRKQSITEGLLMNDIPRRQSEGDSQHRVPKRLIYSTISTNSSRQSSWDENIVQYSTVHVLPSESPIRSVSREDYYRRNSIDELESIYDTPNCEPTYWEVGDAFVPIEHSGARRGSIASNRSQSAALVYPMSPRKSSTPSTYKPGMDEDDRNDDFDELPPVIPKHRKQRPHDKELVKIGPSWNFRPRLASSGDVLEPPHRTRKISAESTRQMGSMDSLDQIGKSTRSNSVWATPSTDITRHLQEQEKILDRLLADTRHLSRGGFKPYQDPELLDNEPVYTTPSTEKTVTKVAAGNIRGYAYKVQIPRSNKQVTQYDVPRKNAPTPDLSSLSDNAPPKPRRN